MFLVAEKTSPVNYRIESLSANKTSPIVHVERLKPYTVCQDNDDAIFWEHTDVSINGLLETFTETDLQHLE